MKDLNENLTRAGELLKSFSSDYHELIFTATKFALRIEESDDLKIRYFYFHDESVIEDNLDSGSYREWDNSMVYHA